jgi:rfaE bifunctional protein kinase chain/domain
MIGQRRFEELLSRFDQVKIAVLGDFFLDLYLHMDRSLSEFSLETHKEAFQVVEICGQAGAAGVAVNNLAALGAHPAAIGYSGRDGNGFTLRQALKAVHANTEWLVETNERFTPTYIKPMMHEMDGRDIELNRLDVINRSPNPHHLNVLLASHLQKAVESYDGVLVIEQVKMDGYGTMSPILRATLSELSQQHPEKIIIVDSRHFAADYQALSLKLNLPESLKAMKRLKEDHDIPGQSDPLSAAKVAAEAFWKAHYKPVYITLGENGIAGMGDGDFFYVPAYRTQGPIDIVGAGDSVLAGIGLTLCAGGTFQEAAYIGNLVGSITIQQIGTTGKASQHDLRQRHKEYQRQTQGA